MFNGPFHDASLFHASCVPSGGRHQLQSSSRLLLHSSSLDWTIVTAFCSDFLPTSSNTSSLFRTLLHGSSSESDEHITQSCTHQPSLAVCPTVHLLQTVCPDVPIDPRHFTELPPTVCPDVPINPRHFTELPTVMFQSCRRHDILGLRSSDSHRLEVPP